MPAANDSVYSRAKKLDDDARALAWWTASGGGPLTIEALKERMVGIVWDEEANARAHNLSCPAAIFAVP